MTIVTGDIILGDALTVLKGLDSESVNCCVTSPPYYGLRDYGVEAQIGQEETVEKYVKNLVEIFAEVKRVLKEDGTLWLNLGDSYANNAAKRVYEHSASSQRRDRAAATSNAQMRAPRQKEFKHKNILGIPWRVALALQDAGWILRQDIIWHKPNAMPESVKDRCTKSHEYIFFLAKSPKYFFNSEAIKEPVKLIRKDTTSEMRNKRSVWSIATSPYKEAHFATFPKQLVETCILAGSDIGAVVLDPFSGSATTGQVALANNRSFIGIEINQQYLELSKKRILKQKNYFHQGESQNAK